METELRQKRAAAEATERAQREAATREHIKRLDEQRAADRLRKRSSPRPGGGTHGLGRDGSGIHSSGRDGAQVLQYLQSATPCQILDIRPTATDAEIKKAYRRLALQYHPDRQKSKSNNSTGEAGAQVEVSVEIFKLVSAAYDMLTATGGSSDGGARSGSGSSSAYGAAAAAAAARKEGARGRAEASQRRR